MAAQKKAHLAKEGKDAMENGMPPLVDLTNLDDLLDEEEEEEEVKDPIVVEQGCLEAVTGLGK